MSPRRVLLTADAVGGVWQYVLELARGLAAHGTEPVIVVLGPRPSDAQRTEAHRVARLVETGLPLDWTADNAHSLQQSAEELSRLALAAEADLVHLHAPAFAGLARWPMPIVSVAHSRPGTWWRAVRGTAMPEDMRWRVAATARGLRASDAVIAPSEAFAAALRATHGEDVGITVVRNGRRAPNETSETRERAVLAAGRIWDEAKNFAALDRLALRLDVPLYAAGPSEGPNGETRRFQNLRLLGTLDEAALRRRCAGTKIFASLARYEPFGLSALEAAQAGMTLLLSDIPTFRELWGDAALFVAADAEADAVRALRRLLDDPALAARRGALARERARTYTVDAMVAGTAEVHRSVLARAHLRSVA